MIKFKKKNVFLISVLGFLMSLAGMVYLVFLILK